MKDEPEAAKFVLRMPPKLHKKVKKLAAADNISMNTYIVQSMNGAISPAFTLKALIQRLEAKKVI